jgi:hypothetical protein
VAGLAHEQGIYEIGEALEPKYGALMAMAPVKYGSIQRPIPLRGIYLFSEGTKHLYVGRTNRLSQRLRGHCAPSGSHFTATFAFRIARETTGMLNASYTKLGSRAELVKTLVFATGFTEAKRRVASMDLRFIEESDPTRQALLEIYTAARS